MHPFFLRKLSSALQLVGIENKIINPFEFKTKGEVMTECQNQTLLRTAIGDTVSCSHATRRQDWRRKAAANCGYCVPCLFRRAASNACGWDDGKKYGIDVCRDEITIDDKTRSAEDLRALLDFVSREHSALDIKKLLISVAQVTDLDKRVEVVMRGIRELRAWIAENGSPEMQHAAHIEVSADD
jgi:hypothetical protein